jgi:hypothetical protein
MSKPPPDIPAFPETGRGLAISFVSTEVREVRATQAHHTGVLVDPAGAVFVLLNGHGHALRFDSPEDPLRLALVLIALSDKLAGKAAIADAALNRILAEREAAGNG